MQLGKQKLGEYSRLSKLDYIKRIPGRDFYFNNFYIKCPTSGKILSYLEVECLSIEIIQSQALNAPQHSYSYAPHRPTLLRKWMPNHDRDITWGWIKEALTTITEAKAVYGLFNMQVKPSLCTLSKLDMVLPGYEDVHRVLKRDLSKLSSEVKKRKHEYDYLDPDKIACSIDI